MSIAYVLQQLLGFWTQSKAIQINDKHIDFVNDSVSLQQS